MFGYSYLEHNADTVNGVAINGVLPTYAAIADGRYPGSRPLYLYVKKGHLRAIPGLDTFLRLYAAAWDRRAAGPPRPDRRARCGACGVGGGDRERDAAEPGGPAVVTAAHLTRHPGLGPGSTGPRGQRSSL